MEKHDYKSTKESGTLSSLIWKFGERITSQIVSALISIILARILSPNDYGIITIVTIMITICNTFVTGGFGNSLIQKKNADETDYSSVFYVSIVISLILYAILFFTAPIIAYWCKSKDLALILRVMGIRLPIAAINSVQQAYVAKNMQFRKFFTSTLSGTIISAVVGIIMAYQGYGPWALVAQYLTNVCITTIVLFFVNDWRPKLLFSFKRVISLLSFGWKILCSSLLDVLFDELRSFIIFNNYSALDLTLYSRGKTYPHLIANNVNNSLGSVLFPVMSHRQDSIRDIKLLMKKAIKVCSFVLAPLLFGLFAISERFISVVLTDKWLECLPYLRLTSIMSLFYPIHVINIQALKALGESGKVLRIEIINKIINLNILLFTMRYGVLSIAYSELGVSLISTYINAFHSKKLLSYSFLEQIKDSSSSLLLAALMAIIVIKIDPLISGNGFRIMIIDIFIGGGIYLLLSYVFRLEALNYITKKIINFVNSKKAKRSH